MIFICHHSQFFDLRFEMSYPWWKYFNSVKITSRCYYENGELAPLHLHCFTFSIHFHNKWEPFKGPTMGKGGLPAPHHTTTYVDQHFRLGPPVLWGEEWVWKANIFTWSFETFDLALKKCNCIWESWRVRINCRRKMLHYQAPHCFSWVCTTSE